MANYYRPRLHFMQANQLKRKTTVPTDAGKVTAEEGDYVVVLPNGARTVMKKEFFEWHYESAEGATVFCDICVDFDGVLHAYVSGWKGAAIIPDEPVEGALDALRGYLSATPPLTIAVYSSRSTQADGIQSMRSWIDHHDAATRRPDQAPIVDSLLFPHHQPVAHVYLNDRAMGFRGEFPSVDAIRAFRVWNEGGVLVLP